MEPDWCSYSCWTCATGLELRADDDRSQTTMFAPSIAGLWFKAAAVLTGVATVALWWMPLGVLASILSWVGAVAVLSDLSSTASENSGSWHRRLCQV